MLQELIGALKIVYDKTRIGSVHCIDASKRYPPPATSISDEEAVGAKKNIISIKNTNDVIHRLKFFKQIPFNALHKETADNTIPKIESHISEVGYSYFNVSAGFTNAVLNA